MRSLTVLDHLRALERATALQGRAVAGLKIASLRRLNRIKMAHLEALAAAGPGADLKPRLEALSAAENDNIACASARLEEICSTIETVSNRKKLLKFAP